MLLKQLALALTALAFAPSAAHLFELPGKARLGPEAYFTVQGIYAGWAWFAVPILGAIAANVALFFAERRRDGRAAGFALVAAALIVVSLGVFLGFVFPGNRATDNWTVMPEGWQALRRAWEFGHAASALLMFAALLSTGRALAGGARRRASESAPGGR